MEQPKLVKIKELADLSVEANSHPPFFTSEKLASGILEKLDAESIRELALLQLSIFVKTARRDARERRRADDPYLQFLEGWRSLGARLPLPEEEDIQVGRATLGDFRKSAKVIRAKNAQKAKTDPLLERIERAIERMGPYVKGHSRLITYQRVCEWQAAGVTPRQAQKLLVEEGKRKG